MNTSKESLRIIWTIASKDILDAARNKTIISIIVGVAFLLLGNKAMPLLLSLSAAPTAIVYDAGESEVVAQLRQSRDLRVHPVSSLGELEQVVAESEGAVLGLAFPKDFDQLAQSDRLLRVNGYWAHWVKPSVAVKTRTLAEQRLTELAGPGARVTIEEHTVYPRPDSGGRPFMVSLSLVVIILAICGTIVPFLMVEERETHTMDALLVSPASAGQVVMGKALAGTTYGLVAAGVVFAINRRTIVHWEVALLAALCGTLFAVAVGLLLGSLFENPQSMNLWLGGALLLLLVPVFLVNNLGPNAPETIRAILPWIPSVLLASAVRGAFSGSVPWGEVGLNLGMLLSFAAVVLALVAWQVRRSDR